MGDVPEQQDAQQEEKPKSKLLFIVVGFAILLAVIGIIAFVILGGNSDESSPTTEIETEDFYPYEFPEPFVGNLAPPDDQYLYTANVGIEIVPKGSSSETEALTELGIETEDPKTMRMRVENVIHEELRKRTRTELTSTAGQEALEVSIKNRLNMILQESEILNVYVNLTIS